MADDKGTFRPIGEGDAPMYGTPAIIIAGFEPVQQQTIRWLLNQLEMQDIPLTVLAKGDGDATVHSLTQRPDGTNMGTELKLPTTIILSGLIEKQLHRIMTAYREMPLPRPMWASVTPTSAKWTAKSLLKHLVEERMSLKKAREAADANSV